jgi:gas vesicle protein
LRKLSTLFKTQPTSAQAYKTEKASTATIFSRGKESSSKLLLSLKNLFSRTDKSSAKAAVTQEVPKDIIGPIKSETRILAKPGPDLRSRVRQVYRQLPNQTEATVSKFDSVIHKLFDGVKLSNDELTTLQALAHIKTFVEQNEEMDTSIKDQLLKDVEQLENLAKMIKKKLALGTVCNLRWCTLLRSILIQS